MDTKELVVDETYKALRESFLPCGKGRPKNVPTGIQVTNKLLVQLFHLRLEGNKSKQTVDEWMVKLNPQVSEMAATGTYYYNLSKSTEQKLKSLPRENVTDFLHRGIDLDFISETLSQYGVTRRTFCFPPATSHVKRDMTVRFVIDLDQFRVSQNLQKKYSLQWIKAFHGECDVEDSTVNTQLESIQRVYKKKVKDSKRNPAAFEEFLNQNFTIQPKSKTNTVHPPVENGKSDSEGVKTHNAISEERKLKELVTEVNENAATLECALSEVSQEKFSVEQMLEKVNQENKQLKSGIGTLKCRLEECKSTLQNARKREQYVRERNDKCLKLLEEKAVEVNDLHAKNATLQDQVNLLKEKIKCLTKQKGELETEVRTVRKQMVDGDTNDEIELKTDQNNAYRDNVRETVMQLMAEAGVSAENCAKVIHIVSKCIFNKLIKDKLPCRQTCLNMIAEGQVISYYQTAESVLKSDAATLHLDGTSRDHSKFVNHQITTDDGRTYFLGFTLVAKEDANTLLEITISLLKQITNCYSFCSKEESHEIFQAFLKKIRCTMTDRAATMKCFSKKFEEFLQSETGEDVQIHFLNCNAHFLLGLSTACDKAIGLIEKDIRDMTDKPIGRDRDPQFSRFKGDSETCANRLIRVACDILGPRGDQKNGYRVEWLEYCKDSRIPCFKSNRFNCFFEASAAIIHHCKDIKSFLSSGVLSDNVNLKVKSLAADMEDKNLLSCLCALAVLYCKVTAPYWNLLKSSVTYTDFHKSVQKMHAAFCEWSTNPSDLISSISIELFSESETNGPSSDLVKSVQNFLQSDACDLSVVEKAIKGLMVDCIAVLERQLEDFLTGVFSFENPEAEQILKQCPVTNLVGESAFGDLDYDFNRRANCSILNRSASHSVKRNKTASEYLSSKTKEEKVRLFSVARKRGRELYSEMKSQEREVSLEVKRRMLENQEKKMEKYVNEIGRNAELLKRIGDNGGVCETVDDVECILVKLHTQNKSTKAITDFVKDQLRYHKTLRGAKHLNLNGNLDELVDKLKAHLKSVSS